MAASPLIAIDDINPQAPMHVLVIPKLHIATLSDLDGGHRSADLGLAELISMLRRCTAGAGARAWHAPIITSVTTYSQIRTSW
jgi:histidine triad (HIT) family protein